MYKIAICDDNLNELESINKILKRLKLKECIDLQIDCFTSGEEMIANNYNQYNIAILDIQMGQLSGVEVAKIIRSKNKTIQIIFATHFEQYWPEGYTVNAFRYLIKPIQEEELVQAIKEIIRNIMDNKESLVIKETTKIATILIAEIKYLTIEGRKVAIHTTNNKYLTTRLMKEWKSYLSKYPFASPHNSYLVNLKFVKSITKENVTLVTGEQIYMSQRKYQGFKKAFLEYISSIC